MNYKSRLYIPAIINSAIDIIFSLLIIGLVIRFLFRLFAANPDAGFVEFIYSSTSPLLDPFRGIFQPQEIEPGHILEFSTLVAIVFYIFIAWLIVSLVAIMTNYIDKASTT